MVSEIYEQFCDYFENYTSKLPSDIKKAAFHSAIYTFAVSAIIHNSMRTGLVNAALAATVSLISSLTTPFFRKGFADKTGHIKFDKQVVLVVINMAFSQACINRLTAHRVDLFCGTILTLALHVYHDGFKDQFTYRSRPYIFV